MTHPKLLGSPVTDQDILEGLANAGDAMAGVTANGDLDQDVRDVVYRFLEDLPDSWSIEELMRKLEGRP